MYYITTVGMVLAVLLSSATALSRKWLPDYCTSSSHCSYQRACVLMDYPSGVFGECIYCGENPEKCLVSVENCAKLHCTSDQMCYVSVEIGNNTVVSRVVCASKNPCVGVTCKSGSCSKVYNGIHPPTAECTCDDPCEDYDCPDKLRCFVNTASNPGDPCSVQPKCVRVPGCDYCYFGTCVMDVDKNGYVLGYCDGTGSHIH